VKEKHTQKKKSKSALIKIKEEVKKKMSTERFIY